MSFTDQLERPATLCNANIIILLSQVNEDQLSKGLGNSSRDSDHVPGEAP